MSMSRAGFLRALICAPFAAKAVANALASAKPPIHDVKMSGPIYTVTDTLSSRYVTVYDSHGVGRKLLIAL